MMTLTRSANDVRQLQGSDVVTSLGGPDPVDAYRRAFDRSPLLMWVSDLDTGWVVDANEAFARRLGHDREAVRAGVAHASLLDSAEGHEVVTRQLQTQARVDPLALTLRARDGSHVFCRYSAEVVENGGRRHLVSMAQEASDRPSDRLEVIGALAGGVAHDVNNILAALAMHVELLAQPAQLPNDLRRGLRELDSEIKRASRLTRQLLLLGRRQGGEGAPVEVNGLVADLTAMLRRLLGTAVSLGAGSDAHELWVVGDSAMIEQVVTNLVVNARDAMPAGGAVAIRTSQVEVRDARTRPHAAARKGSFVMLEVEDTGCGIDPRDLGRIFEPFFTTKAEGTGIGLASVHGIVKQHGGWIEVESAPGEGARFRVMLPSIPAPDGSTGRRTVPLA